MNNCQKPHKGKQLHVVINSSSTNIMAASQLDLTVEIDGDKYYLNAVPAAKSKVVLAEKEKILCLVDLKTLVADLGRVGQFIRIAYNGVMAAGPRYTEIQIEIQQLGFDITKLCDASALTIAKFKTSSATVLSYLQATYMYLVDNYEDMAVETLSSVSKTAGDMEKVALELHVKFEEQKERVVSTLHNTQRATLSGMQYTEDKARERQDLEDKQKYQQGLMEDDHRLEREAEVQRWQIKIKGHEVISGLKKLLTGLIGIEVNDDERAAAERKAKHWKEKQTEALEKEGEYHQPHYEALERMISFVTKIKDCQSEENMVAVAENALQQAFTTLAELSTVMMQAANFWKQIQEYCKSLAKDERKGVVQKAMNEYSDEKRIRFWTTEGFKAQAIRFYAGWVVLNDVCMEYGQQIKVTREELYQFLRESPTYEECHRDVHKLAEAFLNDLKRDQKAIADKSEKGLRISNNNLPNITKTNIY